MFNDSGTKLAAQSEMHYLNKDQFFVLARDSGKGYGMANSTTLAGGEGGGINLRVYPSFGFGHGSKPSAYSSSVGSWFGGGDSSL